VHNRGWRRREAAGDAATIGGRRCALHLDPLTGADLQKEVAVGVLQRFERRLEGLVNGAFAKAFKADVQPVEIASALQRELDDRAAIVSRDRTMAPNDFVVELGEHDHERLSVYSDTLAGELADVVRGHADQQHYQLSGPVTVRFDRVDDLDIGMFRIRSQVVAGVVPLSPRQRTEAPAQPPGPGGETQVVAAQAWLEVGGRRHPLPSGVTTLGRGTDVDLRIDDPGVSRRHAEIRHGTSTVIVDLGSTNGMVVDGRMTKQAPLDDGSRMVIGNTTLIFRRARS
jgi:hypothetical protein